MTLLSKSTPTFRQESQADIPPETFKTNRELMSSIPS